MRRVKPERWVWVILLIGIVMIGIGLIAPALGLDAEAGFGPRRVAVVGVGALVILWAVSYPIYIWINPRRSSRQGRTIESGSAGEASPTASEPSSHSQSTQLVWVRRHALDLAFGGALILGMWASLWIFSAGRMTEWPSGTRYAHYLGEAFRNGQLHLLIEPDPRLADLENPYDLHQRKNIPVLWDASYYNGNYYLYWGAVPGLLVAGMEWMVSFPVRDSHLVLLFVWGAILFSLLFLRLIWLRAANSLPAWVLLGGMFALAVNAPLIWLLTRPSIYEAAIAGGQCFLMAGLYFAFAGLTGPRPVIGKLILAGIAWALAVGTRTNLLPVILFLSSMALAYIYQSGQKDYRRSRPAWLALSAPLLMGMAAIAWYNYARFGSVLESGHRYQLTGLALPAHYGLVTSFRYILPNLYSYLARLPRFELRFPFVSVPWIKEGAWPGFIPLPETYYYTEPVAGLPILVPVIGLAGLVALIWFYLIFHGAVTSTPQSATNVRPRLSWLVVWLAGAALLELLVLLVFISSSLRYLADLTPTWILLATLFIALAWSRLLGEPWQRLLTTAWLVASSLTVLFGLLIGLTGYEGAFRELNPALFQQLLELFR